MNNVSPRFKPSPVDARIANELIALEATPQAVEHFARVCSQLTDYGYWYILSTLWVSYTGHRTADGPSDLDLWRWLFRSRRPHRSECLMKPDELRRFKRLGASFFAWRAHRPEESDWISYTLEPAIAHDFAARYASEYGYGRVQKYRIRRGDTVALFTRRNEDEIIMLDPKHAEPVGESAIVIDPEHYKPEEAE